MLKFTRVPLLFLFIGSLLGLFLRWQFLFPTRGVNYSYVLHAHSHVMFLGWVFNVLFIGFTTNHILKKHQQYFRNLFITLQVFVVGMLIAFPLEGYGFYSILFSTLHTIAAIVFIVKFLLRTKYITSVSAWHARIALVFFLISTAWPFSLGYLMANGLGQSNWYYFSIYFYLHFQYNGFFLFGIFSLLFNLLEKRKMNFNQQRIKTIGSILAISTLPAYFLSLLWAKPGYGFNVLAGLTGFIQIIALVMLIDLVIKNSQAIKMNFTRLALLFLSSALFSLIIKSLLQLVSSIPYIAQMTYELRPIVIAYLHLVLVGVISLSLLIWYYESDLLAKTPGKTIIGLFLLSFVGMEFCLVFSPWWSSVFGLHFPSSSFLTFLFSLILSISCLLFVIAARPKKLTKISL
jgi:hypothetical protein